MKKIKYLKDTIPYFATIIIVLIIIAIVIGIFQDSNIRKIKIGMTKNQVIHFLGNPNQINDNKKWGYGKEPGTEGGSGNVFGFNKFNIVICFDDNDMVTTIERHKYMSLKDMLNSKSYED